MQFNNIDLIRNIYKAITIALTSPPSDIYFCVILRGGEMIRNIEGAEA